MDAGARNFLESLLLARGPSGAEQPVQRLVEARLDGSAEAVESDVHGNLLAAVNTAGRPRVMLATHCDQVGLMVTYIDLQEFLFVEEIGGVDEAILPGTRVVIETKTGPVTGVIGKKATHLETKNEKSNVPSPKQIWIDIGANSREDAEGVVTLGDYVTFEGRMLDLRNGLVAAPSLDRAGLFSAVEAFRGYSAHKGQAAFHLASTVQEELGMRGATTVA